MEIGLKLCAVSALVLKRSPHINVVGRKYHQEGRPLQNSSVALQIGDGVVCARFQVPNCRGQALNIEKAIWQMETLLIYSKGCAYYFLNCNSNCCLPLQLTTFSFWGVLVVI